MSSGPRSLAFLIWIGRPGGWKMVHVSWGWKREGFVGQRYPTFNALVRRKMKNNQRKLAATDLVLPSYHTQLKIIQPLSRLSKWQRPFRGLHFSLAPILQAELTLQWGFNSQLPDNGGVSVLGLRNEGSSLDHGKGGSWGCCMLCVLLRPQYLILAGGVMPLTLSSNAIFLLCYLLYTIALLLASFCIWGFVLLYMFSVYDLLFG